MFGQQINTRSIVFNLIMINIVMFILTWTNPEYFNNLLGLHYFANPSFKPIQLVSHMFMHGGIAHIFFNMFALWMFGTILETVWGPKRFLVFYFVTGFGAVALHMAVQAWLVNHYAGTIFPTSEQAAQIPAVAGIFFSNTVGASGAIFGVLVAFGMLFPNTEMIMLFFPVPIKAKYLITGYILLELYEGVAMQQGDNVAHFAHLGGALFGFILVKLWSRDRHNLY